MKILSVTTAPLSDSAQSWRTWNIANLLQKGGHDVHLVQYSNIINNDNNLVYKFRNNNIRESVRVSSKFTSPFWHLRELSKEKYDLVYCNASSVPFRCILGKLKRIPLIFDMHGGLVEEFLLANPNWKCSVKLFNLLIKKAISFVDLSISNKIVCVSNDMISYLHNKRGVSSEKMAYVTNGVDLEFFRPLTEQITLSLRRKLGVQDKFIFGYVGNFQEYQGVNELIEAAKITNDPRISFVIVGCQGKNQSRNIIFIPKIPRHKIPYYYAICDVLVLPRPSHPATEIAAPTKFSEYVAMGKPILTTNVGDAAILVKEYNCGIVVKSNSAKHLYEGIMQLIGSSRKDLIQMGQNSRQLAKTEFDWNKVKDNLLKVIEEIMRKR